MADVVCGYSRNRDEVLVAYLYDDIDPPERVAFSAHLTACERCRAELAGLRGVQAQLGKWAPPEPVFPVTKYRPPAASPPGWWRAIPAWAQVAAALLFLGVAAGIANLDVRYNNEGLTVRTGWSGGATTADARLKPRAITEPRGTDGPGAPRTTDAPRTADAPRTTDVARGFSRASDGTPPWRADLEALEQQLRSELRAAELSSAKQAAAHSAANTSRMSDVEMLRRVHAMIDENARQQQNELALRVAKVFQDVNAQRTSDMTRISDYLYGMQNSTGAEVYKNRKLLYDWIRTSQTK